MERGWEGGRAGGKEGDAHWEVGHRWVERKSRWRGKNH